MVYMLPPDHKLSDLQYKLVDLIERDAEAINHLHGPYATWIFRLPELIAVYRLINELGIIDGSGELLHLIGDIFIKENIDPYFG